jgi:hypothetical protein
MNPLSKRRTELETLARERGIAFEEAARSNPGDDVAAIGGLAKLLGIDAMTALNPAPLPPHAGAPATRTT